MRHLLKTDKELINRQLDMQTWNVASNPLSLHVLLQSRHKQDFESGILVKEFFSLTMIYRKS